MVAGYYAFTGTKNLIETNWSDRSEGAQFITNLTAAEVSNLSATLTLYAGKPVIGSTMAGLRGGYKAASAFASGARGTGMTIRNVAALKSVTTSMQSSQAFMRAAFTSERAFTMGGEFLVSAGKTGGAVFVSLAAEEAATQIMKAAGVTSHAALEGNAALSGTLAGMGFLLATEALTGPVGWAMLGIQLLGTTYAYIHGAMADADVEATAERARQERAAGIAFEVGGLYTTAIIKNYAQAGYDLNKAKILAESDPNFSQMDASYKNNARASFNEAKFQQVLDEHFTEGGILDLNKPSLGTVKEDPSNPLNNPKTFELYRKAFAFMYADSVGTKKEDMPEYLTAEEQSYMNTAMGNNAWAIGVLQESTLAAETNKYTSERVSAAQKESYRRWTEEGILLDEDDITLQLATIDPDFYDTYHTNITLDAQSQIFRAFNENSLLLDDIPQNIVDLALQDAAFLPVYKNYTRKMVELADYYNISVQDLIKRNSMTEEEMSHLQDNLRAEAQIEVDKVKAANQIIVDKYNADLAARISSYGADLPDIIKNMSDQLILSGSGRLLLGTTEEDLYGFLKAYAPEVTFTIPEPIPFEFDPSAHIDTTPTGPFRQETLLKRYQDEMVKIAIEQATLMNPRISEEEKQQITSGILTGNRVYTDEDDERDKFPADFNNMTVEEYRTKRDEDLRKRTDRKFTAEELITLQRLLKEDFEKGPDPTVPDPTDPTVPDPEDPNPDPQYTGPSYEELRLMYPDKFLTFRNAYKSVHPNADEATVNSQTNLYLRQQYSKNPIPVITEADIISQNADDIETFEFDGYSRKDAITLARKLNDPNNIDPATGKPKPLTNLNVPPPRTYTDEEMQRIFAEEIGVRTSNGMPLQDAMKEVRDAQNQVQSENYDYFVSGRGDGYTPGGDIYEIPDDQDKLDIIAAAQAAKDEPPGTDKPDYPAAGAGAASAPAPAPSDPSAT